MNFVENENTHHLDSGPGSVAPRVQTGSSLALLRLPRFAKENHLEDRMFKSKVHIFLGPLVSLVFFLMPSTELSLHSVIQSYAASQLQRGKDKSSL